MEKLELSVQKEWRFINDRDMDTAVECLKWGGTELIHPTVHSACFIAAVEGGIS